MMPLWIWLVAALCLAATIVVWSALALASIIDDEQETIRNERCHIDALERLHDRGGR